MVSLVLVLEVNESQFSVTEPVRLRHKIDALVRFLKDTLFQILGVPKNYFIIFLLVMIVTFLKKK